MLRTTVANGEVKGMAAVLVIMMGFAQWTINYVDAKHEEVKKEMKESEKNLKQSNEKIQGMIVVQAEMVKTLKSVSDSVTEVKESVQKTEERVWQIGRDVYIIKKNNGGS